MAPLQARANTLKLKDYVKTEIEKIKLTDNLNDPKLKYSLKLNFDLE